MTYETILVEQRGAVTLVTLNRPQALNALNSQVLSELLDAMRAFDADPAQGCAVITGSEKAFAAGADNSTFGVNWEKAATCLFSSKAPIDITLM